MKWHLLALTAIALVSCVSATSNYDDDGEEQIGEHEYDQMFSDATNFDFEEGSEHQLTADEQKEEDEEVENYIAMHADDQQDSADQERTRSDSDFDLNMDDADADEDDRGRDAAAMDEKDMQFSDEEVEKAIQSLGFDD
ncbi:acidic leucine-rich nuclear phosphoprotein 32 family member B-like [Sycon ciliatum]|uniref:acidic leucine-rich nuclear phosphoprotein 32 family member B-like n=1 Tax=Sycon ciliatum TaxID=27933 RepID=UPI0031F6C06D